MNSFSGGWNMDYLKNYLIQLWYSSGVNMNYALLVQVNYLGLLENVRVRRAGFAYRQEYWRFLRYYTIPGGTIPCNYGSWHMCTKENRRAAQEMSYLFFSFYGVAVGLSRHSVRLWCAQSTTVSQQFLYKLLHPYLNSAPPLPASISLFTHGLFLMTFMSLWDDWNSHWSWSLLSCRICTNRTYLTWKCYTTGHFNQAKHATNCQNQRNWINNADQLHC